MRVIRQHGEKSELFDINRFIPVLEEMLEIEAWKLNVGRCSGEGAAELEESALTFIELPHSVFKDKYKNIFQTIDGEFTIQAKEGFVTLKAVDSTFWEVDSQIPGVKYEFVKLFGLYTFDNQRR